MRTITPFRKLRAAGAAAALLVALIPPGAGAATTFTYLTDTDLQLGGRTLRIQAGSQRDDLSISGSQVTVTLSAGEAFIIRDPGPDARPIENDAFQTTCNVLPDRSNQVTLNGPATVTLFQNDATCSITNAANNTTPLVTLVQPNGGGTVKAGDQVQVLWQNAGNAAAEIRLSLSTDGGQTYPTVVADHLLNNGFYVWTVPTIDTTSTARLRVDGFDQGRIVAFDIADADMTIQGTTPQTPPPPAPTSSYDPAVATATAATIDDDQGFSAANAVSSPCIAGLRIKGKNSTAVYYCGADGKRHAFPNQKIHDSWFQGFNGVVTVSDDTLAQIPLGANIKYRPGVRMIKIQSDPKVYAVDHDGTLRWVSTEAIATSLYGADWNTKIDDISDAFFVDYHVGEELH